MDVGEVAGELYSLPPGEFTAARNRRAAEARTAGDRDLAAAIAKLRRPTRGAWLVNAVVRARPALADELLRLGEEMRRAQQRLAGEELRRLSPRRAELVQELTRAAREAAGAAGQTVSAEMERELQATAEAALADPAAAAAVRAGQLAAPLSYSGLGSAGGEPEPAPAERTAGVRRPQPAARPAGSPEPRPAPAAGRARAKPALARARQAVAEAEAAAERARRDADAASRGAKAALEERSRHERRVAELESELATLRAAGGEIGRVVAEQAREETAARRALRLAEERLARARRDLERLADA